MSAAHLQSETLPELLHRVFGHRDFRPHQQLVCESAAAGRDVLLVMPTGAGKSLCYQLPALARRANPPSGQTAGTALVISPLIALMDDQANKLADLGLRVARIHSGLDREASRQACRDYLSGDLDFLFIAPERMRVPGFPEMLAKRKPSLVAIDEAHCISAWGHDFRPDYRTLGQHLPALRPAPIIALTATATPTVQRDIALQLNLQSPAIFITGFRRENLAVEAIELSKPQRPDFTAKLLKDSSARPAIVYAASRKDADEIATKLNKHFSAQAYHAGLGPQVREKVQRDFLSGKTDVVVATVAFGMGVDKANVRTVVHVALPGSVEAFYQEIGRAGRDGLPSRSVLLHSFADRRTQEFFLEKNYPPTGDLDRVARALTDDFTPVDILQRKLTMDRDTLERSLEKLQAQGVAVMDMNGDVRLGESTQWKSGYEAQVAARRAQIDRMVAFAEGHQCRMTALVQHFGDTTDTRGPCGRCDVCNPQGTAGGEHSASQGHAPDSAERDELRRILRAIEGRGQSTGKLFTDLKLRKDRDDFDTLLEGLARAGLLTLTNDTFRTPDGKDVTYKKAIITHEGHDPDDATLATVWLRSASPRSASKSSKSRPKKPSSTTVEAPLTPTQLALEKRLRLWRADIARRNEIPAFTLFPDTTLHALVLDPPATLDELREIKGMGPVKVEKIGKAILAVIHSDQDQPAPSTSTPSAKAPTSTNGNHSSTPKSERARTTQTPQDLSSRSSSSGSIRIATTNGASAPPVRRPETHSSAVHQNKRPSAPPAPAPLTASQLALEDRLKTWRRDEAKAAGLPTFFILSDTVLHGIAAASPQTLPALSQVRGLPTDKLDRFGAAILKLCRE
jgi:ATP-dependent DNA helicase RecQ